MGTAYTGSAAGSGQAQLFAIPVVSSDPLSIVLVDPNGSDHNELYASFGVPPTRQSYDYGVSSAGASHALLVPSPAAGTWYVLVYNESVATAPATFTLQATSSKAVLSGSTPSVGAANAATTFTVTGGGFLAGTIVDLIGAGGTVYPATTSTVDLPTQITATFAAGSVPAGTYAVGVVRLDGATAQLANAFTMAPGRRGHADHPASRCPTRSATTSPPPCTSTTATPARSPCRPRC